MYGKRGNGRSLEDYDQASGRYLGEDRDRFRDLLVFTKDLGESAAPLTTRAYLAGVREWLQMNGVEFTHQQKKQLKHRTPPAAPRTVEKVLDREILKQILTHLDAKGRALVLALASSGMRLGEALQLWMEDVDLDARPVRVSVRQESTKTRRGRITFLSNEAAEALGG